MRNIGNFAAHPLKDTSTGEILPVEAGEAEWNLETLEALFDFLRLSCALEKPNVPFTDKSFIDFCVRDSLPLIERWQKLFSRALAKK